MDFGKKLNRAVRTFGKKSTLENKRFGQKLSSYVQGINDHSIQHMSQLEK